MLPVSLSIVIVNWNSGELLRECLASIAPSKSALAGAAQLHKVVIVDNGSNDGSQRAEDPRGLPIEWIRNAENRGFAAACNQGAAACETDLILFLNPDTRLFADSLRVAVEAFARPGHERVGIVGLALQDDSGQVVPSCARFPRAHHFLTHAVGLDRVWPQTGHAMTEWDHLSTRRVDQVIGAFFMIRRSLFERLDGFDERFFVYFEEVDLARRAAQSGWASLHVAEARAYHKGGGTSQAVRAKRLFYSLRSRLKYSAKHHGVAERALLGVVTWGLEPLARTALLLLRGRGSELTELFQAYRWLWKDRTAAP